jgi:ElaB/YqjD/DUF883 family membrane-anchored ribosome-binding protein
MSENKDVGAAKVAVGRFESALGDAVGDPKLKARGAGRQVGGHIQETAGTVEDGLGLIAEKAKAAAARASDAYNRVSGIAAEVDPFVREKPYLAAAMALAAGLFIGVLVAGRGSKVVYVKPRA